MDNTLFDVGEMSDYSRSSPSVTDVSGDSEEEFRVDPGNVHELGERFRIRGPNSDVMSAFVGAAVATPFPYQSPRLQLQNATDVSGSQIERELIELIDEHQSHTSISATSFIDTEFAESPESPDDQEMKDSQSSLRCNLTNPKRERPRYRSGPRPIRSYPPGISTELSIFTVVGNNMQYIRADNFNNGYTSKQVGPPITNPIMPTVNINNPAPMMIQILPIMPSFAAIQNGHPVQPMPQPEQVFSVQTTHSTNVLLLPAHERDLYRLSPIVMPIIAEFCNWCGPTYDQIGLETLGENLLATAYDAETVRDRNVRSLAFIDGFEAALFAFQNAGLSQHRSCLGAVAHQ